MAEKAISSYKGQIAVRGRGQTTCIHHIGKTLDLFCKKCNDVICVKCVSTVHIGHDTTLLSIVTPANKCKIQTFIDKTEHQNLIEVQQEINFTQDAESYHSVSGTDEVETQRETLKVESGRKLADLTEQLKRCKKTLQTGTNIEVFDLAKELHINNSYQSSGHLKILSEWDYEGNITPICPKSGDGVWMNNITILIHFTSQGNMGLQIHSFGLVRDISVSPSSHNVWICCDYDNIITELIHETGVINRQFSVSTKDGPKCLCVRKDEHLIVGTKHRITVYTPEGKPVIKTKTSFFRKPEVYSPRRIAICPINDNVAVIDRDKKGDGGKDKPTVIVLDRQLKELCRYGETQHNSEADTLSFDPWDVTYDKLGHLVVADYKNKHLHLVSGDGQYLRLLHTDIDSPRSICLDPQGVLWAVFENLFPVGYVKRLQFTNV